MSEKQFDQVIKYDRAHSKLWWWYISVEPYKLKFNDNGMVLLGCILIIFIISMLQYQQMLGLFMRQQILEKHFGLA